MVYIFDLDGTLADDSHRLHYLTDYESKKWQEYFGECSKDRGHEHMLNIARLLAGSPHDRIEIWTGRVEWTREATVAWLQRHGLEPEDYILRMRPENYFESNDVLKKKWLKQFKARTGGLPNGVFEDQTRSVRMFREAGVPCYQVQEADY